MEFYVNKKSLFDGISIEKLLLCVKIKAITRYADGVGVMFWRKVRDVDQEETGGTL
jgi:hypothetical protein